MCDEMYEPTPADRSWFDTHTNLDPIIFTSYDEFRRWVESWDDRERTDMARAADAETDQFRNHRLGRD